MAGSLRDWLALLVWLLCLCCRPAQPSSPTGVKSVGLPIMNCTAEARESLKRRFMDTVRGDGSRCPTENHFFAALYRADPNPDDKLLMSVGANKGYDIVHFLGLWGTVDCDVLFFNKWAMLLSKMHNYGRTVDEHICGECRECNERFRIQPTDLPPRDPPAPPQQQSGPVKQRRRKRIHHTHLKFPIVVAIDANPRNILSLQRIQSSYQLPLWPINAFISDTTTPSELFLPSCEWGKQHCPPPLGSPRAAGDSPPSVGAGGGFLGLFPSLNRSASASANADDDLAPTLVQQHTISSLIHEMHMNGSISVRKDISLLLIHTEGSEGYVLDGARTLLRSGRVRVLVFSYHPQRWGQHSLHDHIEWISRNMNEGGASPGAACYLLGNTRLWKISHNCWDNYHRKHASTVACVRRGDVWEGTMDGMAVRHKRLHPLHASTDPSP